MTQARMSLDEFKLLFSDGFESQEELLREYNAFLSTFAQLDQVAVPELSASQKDEIFRQSWPGRAQASPGMFTWIDFFRQPALTFALGIVIGCVLMSFVVKGSLGLTAAARADEPLEIEHTNYSRTYRGKIVADFYSELENPRVVLERTGQTEAPQQTVHGTLDNGEVYVVWNL